MTDAEILQIQNELFTNLVIEELTKQRDHGKKKGEFLLDKLEIEIETKNRLKRFIAGEKSATIYSDLK